MCGIGGILALDGVATPPSRTALARMAAALEHRGPDEQGLYRDHIAGLAHARLAIVDVRAGQQPMADTTHRHWIVFNGEIFNHVELRRELQAAGCTFATGSDTEVLLTAWLTWGHRAFARLNGQWAVALWDHVAQELTLARDPSGICPLHLCTHAGRLYFASEVKAIFAADAGIPRAFDPAGLAQTFTFWSIVPPQGVFAGVTELEPGHVHTYGRDGAVREYVMDDAGFPLQPGNVGAFAGSIDDAVDVVRSTLTDATRLRLLRADVPVGCYLSGGLDSSLIAAIAAGVVGSRLQTFSLRFEDAEYDEHVHQRAMVDRLGTRHHDVMVSRRDIAGIFPEVCRHAERPLLRAAPAPLFLLSRFVRGHGVPVVLTGEGADEMFAGYDLFREGRVRRFWARQPDSTWRPRLLERLYPYLARSPVAQRAMARQFFGRNLSQYRKPGFAHGPRWETTAALQRLFAAPLRERAAAHDPVAHVVATLPPAFAHWSPLAQDQHLEIRILLAGYLLSSQGDRMLLGNAVEGRFPFLDPQVIALAHSLPDECKLRGLDEKHVLKRVAHGLVPDMIVSRPKQPYRAPDALAFVGPDAPDWIAEVLSPEAIRAAGVFDETAATRLSQKCRASATSGQFSNSDNMALIGVLSTQVLHHQFIASPPRVQAVPSFRTDIDHTGTQASRT